MEGKDQIRLFRRRQAMSGGRLETRRVQGGALCGVWCMWGEWDGASRTWQAEEIAWRARVGESGGWDVRWGSSCQIRG
jgi:hypothetical protein